MKRNMPKFLQAQGQATSEHADRTEATRTFPGTSNCNHNLSSMMKSKSSTFIRYPYRPSILNLLRRINTAPTDSVGAAINKTRIHVYASFQHHWDPALNFPVLTLVAACDTKLHSLQHERHLFHTAKLTCSVTGIDAQHLLSFHLPLSQVTCTTGPLRMDLVHAYHNDEDDTFQKYVIYSQTPVKPMIVVNVHNLHAKSCNHLHVFSILHPKDPHPHQEKYILGICGNRERRFRTVYLDRSHPDMQLLDVVDLTNIGYFVGKDNPSVPQNIIINNVEDILPYNIFLNVTPAAAFQNMTLFYQWTLSFSIPPPTPKMYPPPPDEDSYDGYTTSKPLLHPQGFYGNRVFTYPLSSTLREVIINFKSIFLPDVHLPFHRVLSMFQHYYFAKQTPREAPPNLEEIWGCYLSKTKMQNPDAHIKLSPLYRRNNQLATWIPVESHPCFQQMKSHTVYDDDDFHSIANEDEVDTFQEDPDELPPPYQQNFENQ